MLLASIAEGQYDAADICFLIALVLALLAVIVGRIQVGLQPLLGWLAVAAIALGLLLV